MQDGTVVIDPVIWQKVEVWFGVPSDATSQAFDRINLLLNSSADYTNSSYYVDNVQIYEVTEYDFLYNQYYTTDSVFSGSRPGETLLNLNVGSTSPLRYINYGKWNQAKKPCSFVIQNPMLMMNNMSPYKQYVPSIYDRFQYYISQPGLTTTGVQANYDTYLSINKIVIKLLKGFTTPTAASVTLTTSSGNATISGITFGDDGIAVLYYSGSSWSQTAWSSPPQLSATGQLQGTLNNVKGIKFNVTGLTINSSLPAEDVAKYFNELSSLSLIEISPRLEIDITPLLLTINQTKEISQGGDGFPIGAISSNNVAISVSNIPVTYNGAPFTIFENDAPEATFYNLMRQGVKFTCAYTSPMGSFTGTIPAGIFYSDGWSVSDIDNVNISAFDQAKYLMMSLAAPQYSATNAGLVEIISDLLNISGISDYDYDSLVNAVDQKIKINYFWSDEQVTLFEVLKNLFIAYQMACYFDEYGMMKFTGIIPILNKFNATSFAPDFVVADTSVTAGAISYISNIIPNSFTETVGPKVGKIILNYKTANIQYSDNAADPNAGIGLIANKREFVKTVWKEDTESGLACSLTSRSIYPQDNYFYFDPALILDSRRTIANNFGDAFIGSEAISYEGIEYSFFPNNMSDINIKKVITVPGDIDKAISEIKTYLNNLGISYRGINYYPTGKAVGVRRGKYNTPIKNHFIFDSAGTIAGTVSPSSYFNYYSIGSSFSSTSTGVKFNYGNAKISNSNVGTAIAVSPNETSVNYNIYSFSFHASSRNDSLTNVGFFFNYNGSIATTEFLTISRVPKTKNTKISLGYGSIGSSNHYSQTISADLYDGKEHRVSIYVKSPFIYINIDGRQVARIKITSNLAGIMPNIGSQFGAYVQSIAAGIASATFTEIYAADFPLVTPTKKTPSFVSFPRYHFQSEIYLKNIVHGIPNIVNHYLWQSKPQIRGIKFYDVKHSLSPVIPNTAGLQKVFYGQAQSLDNGLNIMLERTNPWDVSYSPLALTPFRSRFIAVNNSNQLVYLKAPGDKVGDLSVNPLQIQSNYQFLSDQKIIEKVIDKKYVNTTVQLDTDWVQGDNDAYRILTDIATLMSGFHRDINIQIFGNPLVQLGDFCQLKYTLKRIGTQTPVYYYVNSITQNFQNGLTTTLNLKPMILS